MLRSPPLKSRFSLRWATALLVMLTATAAYAGGPVSDKPNSREIKLLLDARKLSPREDAFRGYWAVVKEVAAAQGIKVRENYGGFKEKRRAVVFIDTETFSIRKTGYVLRQRTHYKKGRLRNKTEYALKFRSRVMAEAAKSVTWAPSFDARTEFEEDMGYDANAPDKLKRIFAMRTKITTTERFGPLLASYGEIFPILLELGVPPDTKLGPVNGIQIDERKVSPGKLDFGDGMIAKPDIVIWYDPDGKPLIGEFSFDHRIRSYDKQPEEATRRLYDFFRALHTRSQEWMAKGSTKTGFTYGANKPNAAQKAKP